MLSGSAAFSHHEQNRWIFKTKQPFHEMGVEVDQQETQLAISVPLTATDLLFYRIDGPRVIISDDLRDLYDSTCSIDETGIYSLLQFASLMPPLSPWKQVRRIRPGAKTTFSGNPISVIEKPYIALPTIDAHPASIADQIALVNAAIDQLLLKHNQSGPLVIMFSGGVDSGLLAARASALGLKETALINYSFGPNDPESLLAEEMAKHLGLPFVRISDTDSDAQIETVLGQAGKLYRYPFGDHSAIPTYQLVTELIKLIGPKATVLDGTGADGAFGMFGKAQQWKKLHSLPSMAKTAGAHAYALTRAWKDNRRSEYFLRLLRRTSQFDFPLSTVAQNALGGIAYLPTHSITSQLKAICTDHIQFLGDPDPGSQIAAMDLTAVCSSIFAQKSKSLFDGTELKILYPFLHRELVALALSSRNWEGALGEPKWVLKASLASLVPHEMVYRRKSGFVAPVHLKFKSTPFLREFDRLSADDSVLAAFTELNFRQTVRPLLVAGQKLPAQTASLVWMMPFLNNWLNQQPRRR
jgi:asparagine synthase (glutamine-hydrolysing)